MSLKNSIVNNFPKAIEFSSNGTSDSLTGAPAPKIFFDSLVRDISNSQRKSHALSIVTIKLLSKKGENTKLKNSTDQSSNQSILEFEKHLALISNCIKSNMRGGEFYARIAENGFWLCIQGDLEEASKAADRFEAKISEISKNLKDETRTEFFASEWQKGFSAMNWVDEVDSHYFS